jgi:hypothetical protein
MTGRVLRALAVAIAIAAAIDPPLTISARGRSRIAVFRDAAMDEARVVADRLIGMLRAHFDVSPGPDVDAEAVVVVGRDYPDAPPPERQRAFTVTLPPTDREANVRVEAVRAPSEVPSGTLIHLEIDVDGANAAGTTSTLVVRSGDPVVDVGRATHAWTASHERWRAAVDVVPVGLPPWHLRVEVSGMANERLQAENVADAMVAATEPLRVLVYELRPSWTATFVRRALERDARFAVASMTIASPRVSATSGDVAPLPRTPLDDVRAVILGGVDRATAADGAVLDRFMRERGGAVLLLPDSRSDLRALSQWLPIPRATERLLERPAPLSVDAPLPAFAASELLTFSAAPGMRVLAASGARDAVIAAVPVGGGRLVLSGALDAWRYRANERAAFDRFWQAAVGGLAAASPPAVDVAVVPPVMAPGTTAQVRVRVRGDAGGVSAMLASGEPVRLWPDAEPGAFHGSFVPTGESRAGRIVVAAGRASGTGRFIVAPGARHARPAFPPLALLAESRGGMDVGADDLSALVRTLRDELPAPSVRITRRPMRSVWWMLPFAVCLGGEWWIRRRRGLR